MPCRKDHRNLTTSERDLFVAALHDAKARGVVDQFANDHEVFFHAAHHSSVFLPWHREFLRRFELELRVYDPRVTIPYWDWRTDTSTTSALWDASFMGGFDAAWSLGRALGSATLPGVQLVDDTLALTPYGSFWSPLEGPVHSPPHNWVSGVMATAASPGDPIFYLHHCMIDLLWAQWQLLHPAEDRYQSSGAGHALTDPMAPWTATPADLLDHRPINPYQLSARLLGPIRSLVVPRNNVDPASPTFPRASTHTAPPCSTSRRAGASSSKLIRPWSLSGPPGTAVRADQPDAVRQPRRGPEGSCMGDLPRHQRRRHGDRGGAGSRTGARPGLDDPDHCQHRDPADCGGRADPRSVEQHELPVGHRLADPRRRSSILSAAVRRRPRGRQRGRDRDLRPRPSSRASGSRRSRAPGRACSTARSPATHRIQTAGPRSARRWPSATTCSCPRSATTTSGGWSSSPTAMRAMAPTRAATSPTCRTWSRSASTPSGSARAQALNPGALFAPV